VYQIVLGTELEVFEAPDLIPLDFCLWGWMKREGYNGDVDRRDEIRDCVLGAAARRRRTRGFRTRVAKCAEVDGEDFSCFYCKL